jgi:hypothetical protein
MRAPAGLSTVARGAFYAAAGAIQRSGRDPTTAGASLRRYALAVDRLETLRESWVSEGRAATVLGARGQTVAHPTLAQADGGALAQRTYMHPKVRAVDFLDDLLRGTPGHGMGHRTR